YWDNLSFFYGVSVHTTNVEQRRRRIWDYAWYAIRKANVVLEKLDEEGLLEGFQEESDHLRERALFISGCFYFEMARYWGGMPYIDRVLGPSEELTTDEFKRLNVQQCALRMAEDFRAAADILPVHWDQSGTGQRTLGHNRDRINKFHALGYLGK